MTSYLKETLINLTKEYKLKLEFADEINLTEYFNDYVADFIALTETKKEWWDYRMEESGHSKRLNKFMKKIAPIY